MRLFYSTAAIILLAMGFAKINPAIGLIFCGITFAAIGLILYGQELEEQK